jgi:hypothetical protein
MHSILMSLFVLAGLLLPTWITTQRVVKRS